MKDIKTYINENYNSKDIEKAIEDLAWGILDSFNQEGVKNWDERDMVKYVNGDKEPDYEEIVNAMIYELEEYGDENKILQYIKKYKSDDSWQESISVAILRAMNDYVKDLM